MKPRLFIVAAFLSLLLCLATAVLWVWSYTRWQVIVVQVSNRYYEINAGGGVLMVLVEPVRPDGVKWAWRSGTGEDSAPYLFIEADHHQLPGCAWGRDGPARDASGNPMGMGLDWFGMRLGLLIVCEMILPAVFLLRDRRLSRSGCLKCGYDLTGNASGVCPECGTAIVGKVGT